MAASPLSKEAAMSLKNPRCGRLAGGAALALVGAALSVTMVMAPAVQAAGAAPGAPVITAKVEVSYRNPDGFAEMERALNPRRDWLDELSRHLARRAERQVPDGQRLLVTVTDVQRAGMIEPWRLSRWSDVRIVRDSTPPRIDLTFQLVTADGAVLREGERRLRDLDFLHRNGLRSSEALAYEKNLIDDWLRREFGAAGH
jgi:hypothetical protein